MTSNSNFLSNFNINNGSLIDILSTVSGPIPLTVFNTDGVYYYTFFGRYFYLGNLLIQFSDMTQGSVPTPGSGKIVNFYFPIEFNGPAYAVILTATGDAVLELRGVYSNYFQVKVENNTSGIIFLAIGPR